MLFKDYKEKLLSNTIETIMINKKVKIRGHEVLILGIIKGEECNQLWTMRKINNYSYSNDIKNQEESYEEVFTNRQELKNQINQGRIYEHMHISEFKIQDEVINFTESQSTTIEEAYGEQIQIIRYLIEEEIIGSEWNDVDINDIVFGIYIQDREERLPIINFDEKIEVTFKVESEFIEKLIEHPMTIRIGQSEKDNKIFYEDSDKKEEFFYLDEVIRYDIWKDTIEKIEKNIEYVEEEYREDYKRNLLHDTESTCPRDKDMIAIYYETKDNTQLRFSDKKYLESKPKYESSCSMMMFYEDREEGINGYNKFIEVICPIEKDFDGEIEVELFSKYESIAMEIVSFEV